MLGDGGENLSHAKLGGVGHFNQLRKFLPRFPRIDGFRRELDAVLNRRGTAADVERGAAVKQDHFPGRTFVAVQYRLYDQRALLGIAAVQFFQATSLQAILLRLDGVFFHRAVA